MFGRFYGWKSLVKTSITVRPAVQAPASKAASRLTAMARAMARRAWPLSDHRASRAATRGDGGR